MEARKVLDEIIEKADPEAVNAFGHEVKNAGKASPEGEGNWAKSSFVVPETCLIALICAAEPTRLTEIPTEIAGLTSW